MDDDLEGAPDVFTMTSDAVQEQYWRHPARDAARTLRGQGPNGRVGIDYGGVISKDGRLIAGAVEGVSALVRHFGPQHTFIVSKAGKKMATEARQEMDNWKFREKTGILIDDAHDLYCKEKHHKETICKELGLTDFIDDRWSVLQHISTSVRRYMFKPHSDDNCPPGEGDDNLMWCMAGWRDVFREFKFRGIDLEEEEAPAPAAPSSPAKEEKSELEKKLKTVQKKLKQVEELLERKAKGDTLNADQEAKLTKKSELEAELAALQQQFQGAPAPAASTKAAVPAPKAKAAAATATPAATAMPAPSAATVEAEGSKVRKKLEKKLREIEALEKREQASLNEQERAKLASKAQLLEELKTC